METFLIICSNRYLLQFSSSQSIDTFHAVSEPFFVYIPSQIKKQTANVCLQFNLAYPWKCQSVRHSRARRPYCQLTMRWEMPFFVFISRYLLG